MMTRLLSQDELRQRGIRFSREHIRRLEEAGKFPRRVKLTGEPNGRHGWLEDEIDEYIKSLIVARDTGAV